MHGEQREGGGRGAERCAVADADGCVLLACACSKSQKTSQKAPASKLEAFSLRSPVLRRRKAESGKWLTVSLTTAVLFLAVAARKTQIRLRRT
jgi:hypothetical protein